jgi:type IV pilus assembly protein PilE
MAKVADQRQFVGDMRMDTRKIARLNLEVPMSIVHSHHLLRRPGSLVNLAGFSIVEIMISVAIMAAIAGVAYPSFVESVRKSRRTDAVDSFIRIQQAQERYRNNNTSYAPNLTALSFSSNSPTSPSGYYMLSISASATNSYTVTASAVSGKSQTSDSQGGISCSTLTVAVTNGTASNTPTNCWRK